MGELGNNLLALQRRLVSKPLSIDEQAWLLDVAQSLLRQGLLMCNQAENQSHQFREAVKANMLAAKLREEAGKE